MADSLNPLEAARRTAASEGRELSLISTRFADAGLTWPEERYRTAWHRWRSQPAYTADGRGAPGARSAIAAAYSAEGLAVEPDGLILTGGSSISYQLLFSVLRDAGGGATVALPLPGYPLFEGILQPLGMTPTWYRCPPETGFLPDLDSVDAVLAGPGSAASDPTPGRPPAALVLISPNNPAGITYPDSLVAEIARRCASAGTLLILDEVFSLFRDGTTGSVAVHRPPETGAPIAHLNGVSKLCAAPEVKLGWIAVEGGDPVAREELLDALDTAHDTYLTLSGFAEAATGAFVADREAGAAHEELRRRVAELRRETLGAVGSVPWIEPTDADSGIHIPVRIDPVFAAERFGTVDDEAIATRLVRETGVFLHPGSFYGLDHPAFTGGPWGIVSAITPPAVRDAAVATLRRL